jgi:hypothetical protein
MTWEDTNGLEYLYFVAILQITTNLVVWNIHLLVYSSLGQNVSHSMTQFSVLGMTRWISRCWSGSRGKFLYELSQVIGKIQVFLSTSSTWLSIKLCYQLIQAACFPLPEGQLDHPNQGGDFVSYQIPHILQISWMSRSKTFFKAFLNYIRFTWHNSFFLF